ncbi:hypothetical protein CLAFUR0_10582 [Fulvia fulva]|nr:hypothetical protein CLAFUR0_10582 [Fulvia fulva]
MGCKKVGHDHIWPDTGTLIIQSCERRCNFCAVQGLKKRLSSASGLREHVRSIHVRKGPYKGLTVSDLRDEERAQSESPGRRGRARHRALTDWTPTPGPSKRRRQESPDSVNSGAYCGINAGIKKERQSASLAVDCRPVDASSQHSKRQKTREREVAIGSEDDLGAAFKGPPTPHEEDEISTSEVDDEVRLDDTPTQAKNEYAFVTLAKARPTALSFGPALQEVVGDLLASLAMDADPTRLARKVKEACQDLHKAGAQPERVDQVRSLLQHKLRDHLTSLLSVLSSTTTGEQEHSASTKPGKLKKIKKKRKAKDKARDAHPRADPAETDSAEAKSRATVKAAALTPGPLMRAAGAISGHIGRSYDKQYWTQPTFVGAERHIMPEDDFYVLLPFGTPDLPFSDAKLQEVQVACATAFAELQSFQRVFPWGKSLWVAAFRSRTDASAAQRAKLMIRNIPCRPSHLKCYGSPKTFGTDFFKFGRLTLQEVARAFFDACQPYCGSTSQVQLRLQRCNTGTRGSLKLVAYFNTAPGLLRFCIPVAQSGETPFMLRFLPMEVAKECWLCRTHHRVQPHVALTTVMAKKKKAKKSKGKGKAAPEELPESDYDEIRRQYTNPDTGEVNYEAFLDQILREFIEAEAEVSASADARAAANDASPSVTDSEVVVFPDIDTLMRQIVLSQYELRKSMELPPLPMTETSRPLWDAIEENYRLLDELRAVGRNAQGALQGVIKAMRIACASATGSGGVAASKQYTGATRAAQGMQIRFEEAGEEFEKLSQLIESKVGVSQMLAEEEAISTGTVLISELEDLEDVYSSGGNQAALQYLIQQHIEVLEAYNDSTQRHDTKEEEKEEDVDSEATTEEPDEPATPQEPVDYVVRTTPQSEPQPAAQWDVVSENVPPGLDPATGIIDSESVEMIMKKAESYQKSLADELEKMGLRGKGGAS